jgi:hypothetical protein
VWILFRNFSTTEKLTMFPGLIVDVIDFKRVAAARGTSVGT